MIEDKINEYLTEMPSVGSKSSASIKKETRDALDKVGMLKGKELEKTIKKEISKIDGYTERQKYSYLFSVIFDNTSQWL